MVEALCYKRKVPGSIPLEVIGFFKFTKSFQPHYGPVVDSGYDRNEYQESSWGYMAAGA
jgi:hypothetical protein